jgi:hypothetical protein
MRASNSTVGEFPDPTLRFRSVMRYFHHLLGRGSGPKRFLAGFGGGAAIMIGLVWLWVLTMRLAFLDPEYPAWYAKQILLANCNLGDTLILGDSRAAAAIIPARWRISATNLAVGGGEPIEALAALTRAMRCPRPPKRVILSLDAVHFTEPDLFWERTVRFGFVDADEIASLRDISRATGDMSIYEQRNTIGLPFWLRDEMYRVRFPSLYFSSLLRGGLLLRWPRNRAILKASLASRGQYYFGIAPGSDKIAPDGHLLKFRPLPVLQWYFNHLLEQTEARGVPVLFIAVPMHDDTERQVAPNVRIAFRTWLAGFEKRYPGFRVVGDVMPHWPDVFFGDGFSHLNPKGAIRFSTGLERCLEPPELLVVCVQQLQSARSTTHKEAR